MPDLTPLIGFDGKAREDSWALLHQRFTGPEHAVAGPGDLQVTAAPTFDRTVNISPGVAVCCGVAASGGPGLSAASPTVASGTRWDLIALRYDWTLSPAEGGGKVTPVVVVGTAALALPDARERTAGVRFDQPLALVQYAAGQAQPRAIVDLRVRVIAGVVHVGSAQAAAILGVPAMLDERAGSNYQLSELQAQVALGKAGVLATYRAPWSEPAGAFGTPAWLTDYEIPAQNVPCRWQATVAANVGASDPATRYDVYLGFDGTARSPNGIYFDGTLGEPGKVTYQRFSTPVSGVVPVGKKQRLYVGATRVTGNALGLIQAGNRLLAVTLYPA